MAFGILILNTQFEKINTFECFFPKPFFKTLFDKEVKTT